MTSVVDTSVKYFHSAMPGAPVLSGTAGSLIAVLDACLVSGFGLKSVDSLVVAGNVATLNISTGHSAEVDTVILITGATPAGLNGEQRVAATTSTSISFATSGIADQTATGSISVKIASANWAKPFSSTNLAAYQSTDIEASGCLLRVDDTTTTSCRVVGYETMSDVNAGAGQFPTTTQRSGGSWWPKSNSENMEARPWILVSDGRLFYFAREFSSTNYAGGYEIHGFGDIASTKAGDAFACMLSGDSSDYSQSGPICLDTLGYSANVAAELFTPRSYSGVGSSCQMRKNFATINSVAAVYSGAVTNGPAFPNPSDGGLYISPAVLTENSSYAFRGTFPGFYCCAQNVLAGQIAARDTFKGIVSLPGRTLKAITTYGGGTCSAPAFFDITGPWSR